VLGHGAGGGIEARDLTALARSLPDRGVTVALVEQPWRVAGRKLAGRPATLDEAWTAVLGDASVRRALGVRGGGRLVVGGRSAGARVACRTAVRVAADAVVALAFPLHPPGRRSAPSDAAPSDAASIGDPGGRGAELLGAGVPALVVQGERDPFGGPAEVVEALTRTASGLPVSVAAVPHADHAFAVPARLGLGPTYATDLVVAAVGAFLDTLDQPA
jgi:predicted alpha/beta-hydrolase family hydrolase